MPNIKKQLSPKKSFPFIALAFILSLLYLTYLGFICHMVIVHDAIGYEKLGRFLSEEGWAEHLKRGPDREPVYPLIVSMSMGLSNSLSIPYQDIQKIIQILFLVTAQILMLIILKKIKIHPVFTALAILYLGISPALVNSAFRLFSEIATYPFILSIVLFVSLSWQKIHSVKENSFLKRYIPLLPCAIAAALSCVLMTFTKGIFELITPFLILPFAITAVKTLRQKYRNIGMNSLVFISVFVTFFYGPLLGYKFINKKYNGNFVLTNRGAWALYGNTARRMEKLNGKRFITALAYVPGSGFCHEFFDPKDCEFWSYLVSDRYGYGKLRELSKKTMTNEQVNRECIRLSVKEIFKNPFQYVLLMGVESLKMFFWEYTRAGLVTYPKWLLRLFEFRPFKIGLTAAMALLSFLSFLYLTKHLLSKRKVIGDDEKFPEEQTSILLFIFLLMIAYVGLHSFFFVLPRYVYPLGPLYLILIAFSANQLKEKFRKK